MKKIFTTLFIILFTVSMFAQEAEPFTLEYTFKANATAEELYDSEFFAKLYLKPVIC